MHRLSGFSKGGSCIAFALAAAALLAACGGGGTPAVCSVEINADSILSGEGLQERPAATLQRMRPAWQIDDRAVGGLFMAALWAGYTEPYRGAPASVYPRGPQRPFKDVARTSHVVVVEVGGNDALALPTPADFERDLRAIVTTIQAEGRVPVLTGIVQIEPDAGSLFGPAEHAHSVVLNTITHRVADDLGVAHAGIDLDPIRQEDTFDGIHRRPPAVATLLQRIAVAVEAAAPHCKPQP